MTPQRRWHTSREEEALRVRMLRRSVPPLLLLTTTGALVRTATVGLDAQVVFAVLLFFAALLAPVLLEATGGRAVPVSLVVSIGLTDILYTCAEEGGVHAASVVWLPIATLLAAFLGDRRAGLGVGFIAIVGLTAMAVAEGMALLPRPADLVPRDTLEDWITTTWAVGFALIVSSVYERARGRSFERTQEAYQRLASLIGALPHPVLRIAADETLREISIPEGWSVGWPIVPDVLPAPLTDCVPEALIPRLTEQIDGALAGTPSEVEHVLDGGAGLTYLLVHADRMGQGEAIVTVRDVTEQRVLQQRVQLSDQMATLGTLAATVGHELNNPLAAVHANLKHALSVAGDGGSLRSSLEDALDATEQATATARTLHQLSRTRSDGDTLIEPDQLVQRALRIVRHGLQHHARVQTRLLPVDPVRGSEGRLVQVLVNLFTNAMRAMPRGREGNQLEIEVRPEGDQVVIIVGDNGRGMPEALARRAFEPFFTAGDGLGLGLAICREAVAEAGGTIALRSEEQAGTTVEIRLPAVRSRPVEEAPPRRVGWRELAVGRRVLLIDDDPLLISSLTRALSSAHLRAAQDLPRALELLEEELPELILCDVMLRFIEGPELHQAILERFPALEGRFVFLSGGVFSEKARAFFRAHDVPLVHKPIEPELLAEAIASLRLPEPAGDSSR